MRIRRASRCVTYSAAAPIVPASDGGEVDVQQAGGRLHRPRLGRAQRHVTQHQREESVTTSRSRTTSSDRVPVNALERPPGRTPPPSVVQTMNSRHLQHDERGESMRDWRISGRSRAWA